MQSEKEIIPWRRTYEWCVCVLSVPYPLQENQFQFVDFANCEAWTKEKAREQLALHRCYLCVLGHIILLMFSFDLLLNQLTRLINADGVWHCLWLYIVARSVISIICNIVKLWHLLSCLSTTTPSISLCCDYTSAIKIIQQLIQTLVHVHDAIATALKHSGVCCSNWNVFLQAISEWTLTRNLRYIHDVLAWRKLIAARRMETGNKIDSKNRAVAFTDHRLIS